ncbi:TauD/TfdA family dioxygenase [Pseudomonas sp. NKUCC02_KPG]|uniref:TauD/TfdA family dioxygenase n=1 Tax=Pseudomonas sp. NKUCC02_KPG TaxID=2842124 RepID=UPI001C5BEAE2|nr:TauD/TfdA family dioxygenase [Pseudomonas sp. NKUCC02_KPG]MBW3505714.1 TauD/TfdA family dioxygenase [Pseudomonas sp. NKUCC02_KPG]
MSLPELTLSTSVNDALLAVTVRETLESLETRALDPSLRRLLAGELSSPEWQAFLIELSHAWNRFDHAVIRGTPALSDERIALLLALALNAGFKPYRGNKIVKHFKMSPWTTELSQTLRDGHFHTDLNTASEPPRITLIHCRVPDPTPGYGVLRVARIRDLLAELRRRGADKALRFLLRDSVAIVDDRAQGSWSGTMASESAIRFHPETLKAAQRRGASFIDPLEEQLDTIHEAALAVSHPIELGMGDTLLVSNVRALHYRGECTVQYLDFPRHFQARQIHVLHLVDEPSWPK